MPNSSALARMLRGALRTVRWGRSGAGTDGQDRWGERQKSHLDDHRLAQDGSAPAAAEPYPGDYDGVVRPVYAPDLDGRPVLSARVVLLVRHPGPDDLAGIRPAVQVGRVDGAHDAVVVARVRLGHGGRAAVLGEPVVVQVGLLPLTPPVLCAGPLPAPPGRPERSTEHARECAGVRHAAQASAAPVRRSWCFAAPIRLLWTSVVEDERDLEDHLVDGDLSVRDLASAPSPTRTGRVDAAPDPDRCCALPP